MTYNLPFPFFTITEIPAIATYLSIGVMRVRGIEDEVGILGITSGRGRIERSYWAEVGEDRKETLPDTFELQGVLSHYVAGSHLRFRINRYGSNG